MTGRFIHRYSWFIIIVFLLLTTLSVVNFSRLKTDTGFYRFFQANDPELVAYHLFREQTGTNEDPMSIAIKSPNGTFNNEFLQSFQKFQCQLDTLPGIVSVQSLLNVKRYYQPFPGITESVFYLHPNEKLKWRGDSMMIFRDFPLTRHFISKDAAIVKIHLRIRDDITLPAMDSLTKKIDHAAKSSGLTEWHMLGRKYMESEYRNTVNKELYSSVLLSIGLVMIILFLIYRTVWGMLLPLICMITSLVLLYGFLAATGRPLTLMSNLFPTIILIVGISDVIHISSKYAIEYASGAGTAIALSTTIRELGLTTFINSLTTAIGFLSLITMGIPAMSAFGTEAAVGLLIAWMVSIFLLPALITLFNLHTAFDRPVMSSAWEKFLQKITSNSITRPVKTISVFLFIAILSSIGLFYINTNNYVLTSLPSKNRLAKDYAFFNKELGGGRTFELSISSNKDHVLSEPECLKQIDLLEQYLQTEAGVSEIISPAFLFGYAYRITNNHRNWNMPATSEDAALVKSNLQFYSANMLKGITDSSFKVGRLSGRVVDIGRNNMDKLYKDLYQWINLHIDKNLLNIRVTGIDYITDLGHQLRVENLAYSFILELIVVSFIIGMIYKSGLILFITFIANFIPVLFTGLVMAIAGIELRGTTTMIFAIGYVIAVDDTLHFVNRFELERRKGLSVNDALLQTISHTGRAMLMTSLILLGGFLILLHSSFGDVFMHGLLISIIILSAMVTEFTLTPALITLFCKDKKIIQTPLKL